jgi:hypothetical protein
MLTSTGFVLVIHAGNMTAQLRLLPVGQVPILVRGRLVSWIDSKAMFGDDRTHR